MLTSCFITFFQQVLEEEGMGCLDANHSFVNVTKKEVAAALHMDMQE